MIIRYVQIRNGAHKLSIVFIVLLKKILKGKGEQTKTFVNQEKTRIFRDVTKKGAYT
mgnify:CR=1 FL=1